MINVGYEQAIKALVIIGIVSFFVLVGCFFLAFHEEMKSVYDQIENSGDDDDWI